MKPKVSIVVPIYNVDNYLSRCLDSLLSQTFADIEIIAVNDGSTDQSGAILDQYALKDSRIVVVHKPNGGVSSARNEGIQLAAGEYIGFVDPDDWVEPKLYESLVEAARQEQADIVMCSYVREFGTHMKEKKFGLPEKVCYRGEEVRSHMMRRLVGPLNEEIANPEFLDAWGTVWSKLYRSDIIKQQGLHFIDLHMIGTNEDTLFNIHAFYYAQTFVFVNKPYYHYWRANTGSLTSGYNPDLIDKFITQYSYIERFLSEKKMSSEFYLALNNRICLNTLGLGLNTISIRNKSTIFGKINKLSTILNDNRIRRSFKQFELARCPFVWRTFYFCAKWRFAAGFYVLLVAVESLRKLVR